MNPSSYVVEEDAVAGFVEVTVVTTSAAEVGTSCVLTTQDISATAGIML